MIFIFKKLCIFVCNVLHFSSLASLTLLLNWHDYCLGLHFNSHQPHKPVPTFPMYHRVMKTGVIYATSRAVSRGFSAMNEGEWAK